MWYWNTSYVHDLTVAKCEDSYILFAALIYDDEVVVLNVTDPTVPPVELNRWSGRQGLSHNVWPDKTCKVGLLSLLWVLVGYYMGQGE